MWGRNGVGSIIDSDGGGGHWRWRTFDFQRGLSISVVCPIPFVFHWGCRRIGLIVPGNSPCFHRVYKNIDWCTFIERLAADDCKRVFLEHYTCKLCVISLNIWSCGISIVRICMLKADVAVFNLQIFFRLLRNDYIF